MQDWLRRWDADKVVLFNQLSAIYARMAVIESAWLQ